MGKHRGLVSRLKELTPKCMDHIASSTSVLCARLSGELKEVMDKVMPLIIRFVRGTSSTQHRLFYEALWLSQNMPPMMTCCYTVTCAGKVKAKHWTVSVCY